MISLCIMHKLHIKTKLYVNRLLLNILFYWIILVFAYKLPVGAYAIQPTSIPSLQPTTYPSMNKTELICIRSTVITKNISGVSIYNTIPTSIGNVAEGIENMINFNLLILNLRNNILSGSFLFLIESFVDLVTLDLRGNMFVGVIHGSFAFNQDLSLIDNDLSDIVLSRLYSLHLDFFLFNSCTVDECNCGVLGIHPVFLNRIHWQDVSSTSHASLICDLDVAIKYSKLAAMTEWHYLNSVPTVSACTRKVNNNKVFEIDLGHDIIPMPPCSFADLATCDYFYVYCSIARTILESIGKLTKQYDMEFYRIPIFGSITSSVAKLKTIEYFGNYYLLGPITWNISIFVFFCNTRCCMLYCNKCFIKQLIICFCSSVYVVVNITRCNNVKNCFPTIHHASYQTTTHECCIQICYDLYDYYLHIQDTSRSKWCF